MAVVMAAVMVLGVMDKNLMAGMVAMAVPQIKQPLIQ